MVIAGYIWSVITRIVATLVILAMFSRANGAFETMVIAGLTIIYVAVIMSFSMLSRDQFHSLLGITGQLHKLARLQNDPEVDGYDERIKEVLRGFKIATTRFYITSFFAFLWWLIAMFKIWNVVSNAL